MNTLAVVLLGFIVAANAHPANNELREQVRGEEANLLIDLLKLEEKQDSPRDLLRAKLCELIKSQANYAGCACGDDGPPQKAGCPDRQAVEGLICANLEAHFPGCTCADGKPADNDACPRPPHPPPKNGPKQQDKRQQGPPPRRQRPAPNCEDVCHGIEARFDEEGFPDCDCDCEGESGEKKTMELTGTCPDPDFRNQIKEEVKARIMAKIVAKCAEVNENVADCSCACNADGCLAEGNGCPEMRPPRPVKEDSDEDSLEEMLRHLKAMMEDN